MTEPDQYRTGDLAAYISNREMVCHRILEIKKKADLYWYLMKGDANFEVDGWIPHYRVIGRVTKINGRKPWRWIGNLIGFFFRFLSKGKDERP